MKEDVQDLITHVGRYTEIKKELLLLQAQEQVANVAVTTLVGSWFIICLWTGLIFLGLSFSNYLNMVYNSPYLGLLIVAGIFCFIGMIGLLILQKNFRNKFSRSILKLMISKN